MSIWTEEQRKQTAQWCLSAVLFLLPWQTHWISSWLTIQDVPTPFGKISLYLVELIVLLLLFLRGQPQLSARGEKVARALYVLFAAGFLSLTFADQYQLGLFQLLHLVTAGGLFVTLIDKRTNTHLVMTWFLAGLFIPILLGWFQITTATSPASSWFGLSAQDASLPGVSVIETAQGRSLRAYGSFPHPNIFGGYLAVAIVCLAWLIKFTDKKYERFLWIPTVLLTSTLLITFSRGAWLGLIVSFLLLVILIGKRKRVLPKQAKPLLILGIVTLLGTVFFFQDQFFARFDPSLRVESISIEERTSQYGMFKTTFLSRPIVGVGPGGYVFASDKLFPDQPVWSIQPMHNTPLLILAELGLFGFAAFFFFLIRIDQINSAVSKTPGGMFGLMLGVCLLVISLFDHYFWSFWPGLALAAISLGFIVKWSEE